MRVDTAGLANPATARAFGVNSVMMRNRSPSVVNDAGGTTDTRCINQRAVQRNRAALVERLFLDGEDVIRP
jgi:hypothetical protein